MLYLILIYVIILIVDLPPLIRERRFKELAIFSFIMLLGISLSMALVLGLEVSLVEIFSPRY